MLDRAGLEFSFSGLKTAVALAVRKQAHGGALDERTRADIAAGVQEAIVETLVAKALRALEQTGLRRAGGGRRRGREPRAARRGWTRPPRASARACSTRASSSAPTMPR